MARAILVSLQMTAMALATLVVLEMLWGFALGIPQRMCVGDTTMVAPQ